MITNIEELYTAFEKFMDQGRWWDTDNKWEILLGAILVQNTNWRNVDYALLNLEEATGFSPIKISQLSEKQLQEMVRPSGFYKAKSATILRVFQWLTKSEFDLKKVRTKDFDTLRQELLAIKGIGEETADVLLVYVFEKSTFIADKYAQRLFSRMGIESKGYRQLKDNIQWPAEMDTIKAQNLHGWIVVYGQSYLKNDLQWQQGPLKNFKLKLNS
ncbi:MAG: deoxyribonuclease I [Enterococcus sp.]|uniref:endonuclease III domain-containing protein n=1 Tax=Enterococcus sp. TaxID=35783 RepID=UPI002FC6FD6B